MTNTKKLLTASSLLALVLGIFTLPINLPYSIPTTGLVMPVSEWTISRIQNGNLVSILKDNRTGRLSQYSSSVFQRGNQSNFQLNTALYHHVYLHKGDTVATMYSNQDEEELTRLQGELSVQKAQLAWYRSGQKAADVEINNRRIDIAQQELAAQRPVAARSQALFQDSLISRQDYENAVNKLRVLELNLKMAEANFKSATTGDKPERVQVVITQIQSLQRQIQQIQHNLNDLTLIAPVSGTILLKQAAATPMEEVLLSVADNSSFVVVMPVEYAEKPFLQPRQTVKIAVPGTTQLTFGKIITIDNTVQLVDGRQAFFITALIEQNDLPLLPGMLVRATVESPPIALLEHLGRTVDLFRKY
ncbi:HlyD family secretion protein [Larkinella insperata]|uniref:HlyD family secretion protein n=1 Tax=Larkinella insperata TaxID=332158 RepID=A0ABW3QAP3_9BACT